MQAVSIPMRSLLILVIKTSVSRWSEGCALGLITKICTITLTISTPWMRVGAWAQAWAMNILATTMKRAKLTIARAFFTNSTISALSHWYLPARTASMLWKMGPVITVLSWA